MWNKLFSIENYWKKKTKVKEGVLNCGSKGINRGIDKEG